MAKLSEPFKYANPERHGFPYINSLSHTSLGNAAEKTFPSHRANPTQPKYAQHVFAVTNKLDLISFVSSRDEEITSNKTYSFLITLDLDIGELVMIKFKWENGSVWTNVWNTVQTIIPWSRGPLYSGLVVNTIKVKAGETQQR